tara:strand:- start:858 stop:1208 length:351 start_codon:yes stop_codon:yes gene_type:complete
MFDIGFSEILIVGVVALIVLGPERLPMALRTGGLWLSKIKRTIGSVQKEISEELRIEEMRQKAKQQQVDLESGVKTLTKPFHEALREDMLSSSPVPAKKSTESIKPKADAEKPLVE